MRIVLILALMVSFNINANDGPTFYGEDSQEMQDLNNCIAENIADYEIKCFNKEEDDGDVLPEDSEGVVKEETARAKWLCIARGTRRFRAKYFYGYSRLRTTARRASFRKCRRYRARRCRVIRCWYVM